MPVSEADRILARILQWAGGEEPVRAVILQGSRAAKVPFDELADFDLLVFTRPDEPYTQEDRWLSAIGEVWVCVQDKYDWDDEMIPTRLVIFKDGVKVDFSFVGVHKLVEPASGGFDSNYEILVDKDGDADRMPKPALRKQSGVPPGEKDFLRLVNEFWFEAYHVAKYLKREELWLAKSRDWATKELLLKMMEWHAQGKHQWNHDTAYMGKRMKSWVEESTWKALHQTFAHFDADDSWNGLLSTIKLFRQLATAVAENLGLGYPVEMDRKISEFILKVKG